MYTFPFSLGYHITWSLWEHGLMSSSLPETPAGCLASTCQAPAKTHTIK